MGRQVCSLFLPSHIESDMNTPDEILLRIYNAFPSSHFEITCADSHSVVLTQFISPHKEIRVQDSVTTLINAALYASVVMECQRNLEPVVKSMTVNFFSRPTLDRDLVAKSHLIYSGNAFITGEVKVYSKGSSCVLAHAVATFSIPPLAVFGRVLDVSNYI
ncbi:hypothetical protein VIBNISOn1_1390043 [Vibrio nigripulchritudo SOn1]|uniref:Thioesterase domain-containing protein n=1 Tax=Vibrio nigripulchritudo SOn1 TaxID=1238450 RepID=A0AAV2VKD1_9VIBR|nr:hypothetical protein VIBNISOn1_1390043 [Vibrio nigripulchritudo SOn1]